MNPFLKLLNSIRGKRITGTPGGSGNFLFGSSTAGKFVNETAAMQTSAVYACVRILAEAIASLPLHVYVRDSNGGKEINFSHPIYRLLHEEPNHEMTSFIFREVLMSHLLLWGNAYVQIIRDNRGYPTALYPLLPDRTEVKRTDRGEIVYNYQPEDGEKVTLPRDQVLHIPGLGFDGLIGYSPIAMAKNAIGMALAAEEYGALFFGNGGNPAGVLEHPGTIKDMDKLRESWNRRFVGSGNAHGVAILEEGLKFSPISIPPEQAQFLQTRKFQIAEVARIFRVPPHMIGDLEKSSFNNIEHQGLEFSKYTLNPWVVRWEQSLNKALLLPSERDSVFIMFNMDGLLRGDFETRMKGYAVARQNGYFSANDIRRLEGYGLIPDEEGGNLYHMNGNMIPLTGRKDNE